ncbi:MAG TPA: ABC transporter substrate-binding protein [Candidatus Ventricola intestinavium]|nr:ABC transporter substrate-binding protein [Candidatus Ventricola intestinavium]
MKKVLVIALALAMMMTACLAFAEEAVKVGVIGPLTGANAQYGLAVQRGAQIAAEEINAQGGLQLEILAEDDQADGELAVNAYNKLLDDGVNVLLATVTSGSCIAVSDIAYEERVFMLTPSGSADVITEGKDNVYRVCFKDSAQGTASAQYIADHGLATKIGIIYNNALDYSMGIYQSFVAKANELGLEIVAESAFSDDTNADFSVQISQMQEAGAELVFLPIYYTPASMILQQANAVDYAPIFFGVDGMDGILGVEGFDTSLAEGVMLLTPFSADAQDELTKNFVTTYMDLYGETPNQFAADAYDGVYALAAAMQAAGVTAETSPEDACEMMIAAMQTVEITGLTGTMHWDATGEVDKTPTAVVIQDGVYVGAN